MKNNMRSLFKDWRGFLLLEGRRENAAIAIVKKINDPFLRDLLHDFATIADGQRPLASLTGLDPTPNKSTLNGLQEESMTMLEKKKPTNICKHCLRFKKILMGSLPSGRTREPTRLQRRGVQKS